MSSGRCVEGLGVDFGLQVPGPADLGDVTTLGVDVVDDATRIKRAAASGNQLFAYAKTKTQISCAVTAQLISVFVFATHIVHFLFFLNPKIQACSLLLRLYIGRFTLDLNGNPNCWLAYAKANVSS